MQNRVKEFFWPLACFAFVLFVFREWLFGSSILTYSDWMYVYSESHESLFYLPSAWLSTQLGGVNLFSYFFPVQAGMSFLNSLGFSYAFIERVFFMIPAVVSGYFGMYLLSRSILKNTIAAVVSAIVFTFNTYALLMGTSHLTILVAMSLIPWIFLFFTNGLKKLQLVSIGVCSILLGIVSAYEFRIFYITVFLLGFSYLFILITTRNSWREKFLQTLLFGASFFVAGAINLYWLIGLSKAGSITTNEYFGRELFGNEFMSIERAMTLFHPFWTGGYVSAFLIQKIPWFMWSIPVAAFAGLYLSRKNRDVVFWAGIGLLGIFLTKQANPPFGGVYDWLFHHFPGFNSFREASKFYLLIALSYSILIGSCVERVLFFVQTKKIRLQASMFLISTIVGVFLINSQAVLSKKIGALFVPRTIPQEYLIIKNLLHQDPSFSRTLWVPRKSRWSFYTSDHPLITLDEVIDSVWSKYVDEELKTTHTKEKMLGFIQQENFVHLLRYSGVKYVIVPLQDTENDDDFYQYYSKKEAFIEALAKNTQLKRKDVQTTQITVFEVENPADRFFMTSQKELAQTSTSSSQLRAQVSYHRTSAWSYRVELKNVREQFFLHFTDLYNPSWKIYADTEYRFYPDRPLELEHVQNEVMMNTFAIQSEVLCRKIVCQANEDGTVNLTVTLFFDLQRFFFIGIVLGFGGLMVGCITVGVLYRVLKYER